MTKLGRRGSLAAFALAAAYFVALGQAVAADSRPRVQLQVFQVKVVDDRGKMGQVPVTVYIDTKDRQGSNDVCRMAPRLRDALNSYLRKQTYKVDAQGMLLDLAAMNEGARPVIDKSVEPGSVVGSEIRQGAPKVKASAAAVLQRSGCIGVSEAEGDAAKGEAKGGH